LSHSSAVSKLASPVQPQAERLGQPRPQVRVTVVRAPSSAWPQRPWFRRLRRWALILLLLSVAWRLVRWSLQFPIWGDEAYLALNFLDRDYLGLTRPLRCVQVAPLLFLWGELTVYRLLGGGELALRLLPFLAGLATLPLFWQLARLALPARGRYLAFGLFAVSYFPIRHSCEIKPYSVDLLVSLVLLIVALTWQRQPRRLRWLVLLAGLAPLALAASYPAVFIAAAIGLVLLPTAWRQGGKARILFTVYLVLTAVGFLGPYLVAGIGQFESTGGTHNAYWAEWFPPAQPLALLWWLLKAHTGNMMAYPIGGPNGASTATFLVCLAGIGRLGWSRRRPLLALLLVPFALTLAAAALHRYPYGGSARIVQYLAPAICLLAGTGVVAVLRQLRPAARRRFIVAVFALLTAGGVAGIAHDLYKPYKTEGDEAVRRVLREVLASAGPEEQILVLHGEEDLWPTVEWYLRQQPERVALDGQLDELRLARGGAVWVLDFGRDPGQRADLESCLRKSPRPLTCDRHEKYALQCGRIKATIVRFELLHFSTW
jgi:hypothetical protein